MQVSLKLRRQAVNRRPGIGKYRIAGNRASAGTGMGIGASTGTIIVWMIRHMKDCK